MDEEQAITFTTRVFPVPDMELDLESPIAVGEDETAEDAARRALRQRLHGTMPQALLDEATKERREEFRGELASKGQTYREYRIEHGVKRPRSKSVSKPKRVRHLRKTSRSIWRSCVKVSRRPKTTSSQRFPA